MTCRRGLMVLALCGGCKSEYLAFINRDDSPTWMKAYENDVSCAVYRVDIPDAILIFAPSAPEIHNHSQALQPDGKITLELLGEVYVAGLTPQQIADKIELLISEYYDDVEVNVRVTAYNSKKYYLIGEIGSGSRRYTGRDTILGFICLGEGRMPAGAGISDRFDAWVSTTDEELSRILAGEPEEAALRVSGDVPLFRELLAAVSKESQPARPWAFRGAS